ncbi:hypothetical protein FA15DRAFT_419523 [Coprinopsis marcescibilis]|uniref:Uncharacterized protein n=1 Tax=Coprinopsis marcescibilis TaxID=230819 RepID=A0A5C3KWW1_COPMA|nr:hypothetical protein FA15DRAFT_419523 [Coprinopsis marcescibilis]
MLLTVAPQTLAQDAASFQTCLALSSIVEACVEVNFYETSARGGEGVCRRSSLLLTLSVQTPAPGFKPIMVK